MHNDIMAVGSKERSPMLVPGNYAQWSSRFMRYIDTKQKKEQIMQCIKEDPYILTKLVTPAVLAEGVNLEQPQMVREETYINTTPENRKLINAEAEAIHMILNGIGDNIYSTVNVQFLQQLQSEWSRFVMIIKQANNLDTISYHKLFDILKQYQNEVNEIRAERIAKNANPLTLVAVTQHYPDDYIKSPKPYRTHAHSSRQTPSTRTHATTRNKGK
ncbi:hypothetical protein Tco_1470079 [Tanacetum coccineum]